MTSATPSFKGSANTGPAFYLSEADIERSCSQERDNVEDACAKNRENSQNQTRNAPLETGMVTATTAEFKSRVRALDRIVKSSYGYERKDGENAWIEDHCYGLWLKPMGGDGFEPFDKVINNIRHRLEKTYEGNARPPELDPHFAELDRMRLPTGHPDGITSSTVLAEMMTEAAKENPCIQARRCVLVTYKHTEGKRVPGQKTDEIKNPKNVSIPAGESQAKSGKGCCPGQTGHHILPGAMFGKGKGNPCEEAYSHSQAPVVCLEGAGNQVGSHGVAHEALKTTMAIYEASGATTISYKEACEQGIAAVRKVNPLCREECLQAQLDAHYGDKLKCKDAQLTPHSGMGGKKKETEKEDSAPSVPSAADE